MGQSLDILYIGTLPPHQGGSAISMAQILQELVARGHVVRTVAPITPPAAEAGDSFAREHPELGVHRIVMPFLDHSPDVVRPAEYRELERTQILETSARLIVRRRPDLVIAGRESFVWHVPEVATAHDLPMVAFAHGSTTHGMVNGTYPKAMTAGLVRRFRQAELVVTPAEHMAASLRRLGVSEVQVVRNPVDTRLFRPLPRDRELAKLLGIASDDIVVAHLSNMIQVKRTLDIVTAATFALSREPRLRFLLVGEGPLRAEAEEASVRAGIAARFTFVDWVPHADVSRYLSLADMVVQPSEAEGQALVYLETQASGCLLVASDIAAAREVVVDGETGLLFPVGDVGAFARTICRAADENRLRSAIVEAAGESVRSHELPRVVNEHERLLVAVTSRARSAGRRREAAVAD
jgi:glycosyltransferase involved in cell wall biosynthesis